MPDLGPLGSGPIILAVLLLFGYKELPGRRCCRSRRGAALRPFPPRTIVWAP